MKLYNFTLNLIFLSSTSGLSSCHDSGRDFCVHLQSCRLEMHNNWKRRESIFVLLFKNRACPTVSDNELHMALFRCDGELHFGEGPGCSAFCLYSRPICKMVVPEMMYSLLWLISTIFCWNMAADVTYFYDSIFYWKVRKCVQLIWNCSSLKYVFLKSLWPNCAFLYLSKFLQGL